MSVNKNGSPSLFVYKCVIYVTSLKAGAGSFTALHNLFSHIYVTLQRSNAALFQIYITKPRYILGK